MLPYLWIVYLGSWYTCSCCPSFRAKSWHIRSPSRMLQLELPVTYMSNYPQHLFLLLLWQLPIEGCHTIYDCLDLVHTEEVLDSANQFRNSEGVVLKVGDQHISGVPAVIFSTMYVIAGPSSTEQQLEGFCIFLPATSNYTWQQNKTRQSAVRYFHTESVWQGATPQPRPTQIDNFQRRITGATISKTCKNGGNRENLCDNEA